MRNWDKYSKQQIQKGFDENGNRLILEFAKDYKTILNQDLCISCKQHFETSFRQFLNKIGMKNNKTDFILHNKYNGLTLSGYRNDVLSNYKMTEEKALYFILNHKKGKAAFRKLPKDLDKRIEAFKQMEKELHEKAADFEISTANKSIDHIRKEIAQAEADAKAQAEADAKAQAEADAKFNPHAANGDALKVFAANNEIDISGAEKVKDIRAVVVNWLKENAK